MFLKTSNGYLLNVNIIRMIYISSADEDNKFNRVTAVTQIGEVRIYKDIELQECQNYLNILESKIAVNMDY